MAPRGQKLKTSQKIDLGNMVSPTQLRELKEQSQHLKPVVIMGQNELNDVVIQEIERTLNDHELIKIRMVCDESELRAELVKNICQTTKAVLVQTIGQVVTIYRKNSEE